MLSPLLSYCHYLTCIMGTYTCTVDCVRKRPVEICFRRFSYSDYPDIWVCLGFVSVFVQYLFFYLKSNGPDNCETFFDTNFIWITWSINMGLVNNITSWFCIWFRIRFREGIRWNLRRTIFIFLFVIIIFAVWRGYFLFNTVK